MRLSEAVPHVVNADVDGHKGRLELVSPAFDWLTADLEPEPNRAANQAGGDVPQLRRGAFPVTCAESAFLQPIEWGDADVRSFACLFAFGRRDRRILAIFPWQRRWGRPRQVGKKHFGPAGDATSARYVGCTITGSVSDLVVRGWRPRACRMVECWMFPNWRSRINQSITPAPQTPTCSVRCRSDLSNTQPKAPAASGSRRLPARH